MFDIGFWEISLIMLVTLVVVGPERLPKLARTLGAWVNKGRRMISDVKAEVDRELRADELKGSLTGNAIDDLRKMAGEIKSAGDELKSEVSSFQSTVAPTAPKTARVEAPAADSPLPKDELAPQQTAKDD
jgi:sec-independent protein translocase protein TatB